MTTTRAARSIRTARLELVLRSVVSMPLGDPVLLSEIRVALRDVVAGQVPRGDRLPLSVERSARAAVSRATSSGFAYRRASISSPSR